MPKVTRIPSAIEQGDHQAADRLLPLAGDESDSITLQSAVCLRFGEISRIAVTFRLASED